MNCNRKEGLRIELWRGEPKKSQNEADNIWRTRSSGQL